MALGMISSQKNFRIPIYADVQCRVLDDIIFFVCFRNFLVTIGQNDSLGNPVTVESPQEACFDWYYLNFRTL